MVEKARKHLKKKKSSKKLGNRPNIKMAKCPPNTLSGWPKNKNAIRGCLQKTNKQTKPKQTKKKTISRQKISQE